MKRWQKWLLAVFVVIAAITVVLISVYNFYAKDKIEGVLEKVQKVINDEQLQEDIQEFVDEMVETGKLDVSEIKGYLEYKEAKEQKADNLSEDFETLKPDIMQDDFKDLKNSDFFGNLNPAESDVLTGSLLPKNTAKPAIKPTTAPVQTTKPKQSTAKQPETLIERVRQAMTAEEFAFAMSMYGKVDISYCLANYSSNPSAVKKYIKSVLSSSEISRSLEIYGKYAYLLE